LPPTLGEDQVRPTGLEGLLELAGVTLGRDVVLEHDAEQRLPRGSGELFFAGLLPHAVTRGVLHDDDKLSSRVLVVQARSLTINAPGEGTAQLLRSSDQALSLEDLGLLVDPGRLSDFEAQAPRKSFALGAARQLRKPPGSKLAGENRVFVSGASNLAWNRNFQDPALYGNRRLLENAVSWVAAHPVMISVPEKPERELGLSLSEESLGEVARRNVEKRSRVAKEAKG
jgi:hypothetical protein